MAAAPCWEGQTPLMRAVQLAPGGSGSPEESRHSRAGRAPRAGPAGGGSPDRAAKEEQSLVQVFIFPQRAQYKPGSPWGLFTCA